MATLYHFLYDDVQEVCMSSTQMEMTLGFDRVLSAPSGGMDVQPLVEVSSHRHTSSTELRSGGLIQTVSDRSTVGWKRKRPKKQTGQNWDRKCAGLRASRDSSHTTLCVTPKVKHPRAPGHSVCACVCIWFKTRLQCIKLPT